MKWFGTFLGGVIILELKTQFSQKLLKNHQKWNIIPWGIIMAIGIVDEPILGQGQDWLEIKHADALVSFIKETDTPMTIGVQGEWGSEKLLQPD